MPIISTNEVDTHRQVKSRAAALGLTLGKMFDLYARLGLKIELENLDPKDEAKIKEIKKLINEG